MDFIDLKIYNTDLPIVVNIIVTLANVINLIYNIPQMYKTYKRKTTKDISGWFLSLRAISSIIWTYYSIYILDIQYIIANIVTLIATIFIGFYKIKDIYNNSKKRNYYLLDEENGFTIKNLIEELQENYNSYGNIYVKINDKYDYNIKVDENLICLIN